MATAVVPQVEEGEGTAKEEEVPQEYHQLYRKRESVGWKQIKSHCIGKLVMPKTQLFTFSIKLMTYLVFV